MKRFSAKSIAVYALLTALVAAATFAVKIPTLATEGYANLGDTVILFAGIAFGPLAGFLSGGIGSALSDLLGGYAHWVLPTFIIKGAEGALAGVLFFLIKKTKLNRFANAAFSSLPSAILMIAGYFVASTIMKGSAAVALLSVPANCVQGSLGVTVCMFLLFATSKIKDFSRVVGPNAFYDYPEKDRKADEDPE